MTRSPVAAAVLTGQDRSGVVYRDGSAVIFSAGKPVGPELRIADRSLAGEFAFSADGRYLAQTTETFTRIFTFAAAPQTPLQLPGEPGCLGVGLRFSVDGESLVSWGTSLLCAWRVSDGKRLQTVPGRFHTASIAGNYIWTTQLDDAQQPVPVVREWAVPGAAVRELRLDLPSELSIVTTRTGIVLSPAADAIAAEVETQDGLLEYYLWSADGHVRHANQTKLAGGPFVFSPSGTTLLFGERIVDVASGNFRKSALPLFDQTPKWAGIDDEGYDLLRLVPRLQTQMIERVNLRGGVSREFEAGLPPAQRVSGLFVAPDSSQFLLVAIDGLVLHWYIDRDFASSKVRLVNSPGLPLDASFSPNGAEFFISGDGWSRISSSTGEVFESAVPDATEIINCTMTSARFSSQGGFYAMGRFGAKLEVRKPGQSVPLSTLPTVHCNARAAFNANDSLMATTGPAVYRTSDWSRIWPAQVSQQTNSADEQELEDVQFSADGASLLFSHCDSVLSESCRHSLWEAKSGRLIRDLTEVSGPRAVFSAEGHWVVSNNQLLHLPTNQPRRLEQPAKMSAFLPNGDIISVLEDSSIARYCRAP